MYLESVDSFMQQAEDLYRSNPLKCRYCMKYRHCDGKLVVKVTDNATCLQYKTDKQADLKKLDKLHRLFFNLMATGEDPLEEVELKSDGQPSNRRSQGRKKA